MSLDVVTKKIEVIARKPVIKEADIAEVITAAERSEKGRTDGVSNAEGRAVADLYLRTKAPVASAKLPAPKLEEGAVNKLNAFFIAHNLPYGDNKGPMKDRIISALDKLGDMGAALARPPRTGSLQPLRLSAKGDPQKDAYVDVVKKQFIVKLEGNFFGPFSLE
jgi:hypothetical protein